MDFNPLLFVRKPKEDIIKHYFLSGLTYSEILHFLTHYHGIHIGLRQLNRLLRQQGLYRRRNKVPINNVIVEIKRRLNSSNRSLGYRSLHLALRNCGIATDRETVRIILKELDPQGVATRKQNRLQRRKYVNNGPNYLWHLDGYDKIKPFGFAIHGCIDGYSRKLLWLKVGSTNNDPKKVAYYFVEALAKFSSIPRCIRADRGSENVVIAGIQRYLRRNDNDECCWKGSFLYGPSTRNQRIEAWWSILKRSTTSWWLNFFKDFCEEGLDISLPHHIECVRFCFMALIQNDLDNTRHLWNNHRIRTVKNSESPPGRPNVLFYAPHLSDGVNYDQFPVNHHDLNITREFTTRPSLLGCSNEMQEFANVFMLERNFTYPTSPDAAKALFWTLVEEIEDNV